MAAVEEDEDEDVVEDLSIKPVKKEQSFPRGDKKGGRNTQPGRWTICTDINSLFPIPLPSGK